MRCLAGLVLLALLAPLSDAEAAAQQVQLEIRTADGASVGRLLGNREDGLTYVALRDVARLVRGTLRPADRGRRLAVVARGNVVEVRRDSARVLVTGRVIELAGPVRVREGLWTAPGDFLVRALPALLRSGVEVSATPVNGPRLLGRTAPAVVPASLPARDAVPPRPAAPVQPAPDAAPSRPPEPAQADRKADGASPRTTAGSVELRYRSYPGYTRVVLEGAARFEPRLVESQGALVVPLAGLRVPGPRVMHAVRDGLVAGVELSSARGVATLRITFERPPRTRKVYRLTDPPRLVLDFYRPASAAPVAASAPAPAAVQTIVIDPGHGGHDPGAVGPGGLQEKEVTLALARRLAAVIQEELDVRVVLTRTRDQFIPLRERTAIANRVKADLFLSIHVNAARAGAATGTETYFLSSEATDNAARAAAAYENKVIDLEPGPRSGSRDLLRSILWDLAQSEFQQESSRLAEGLQDSLERALRLPSRGVKQAPFYVLGGAAMPAVLIEVGFLSNPQDEERLQDDGYRDRVARALAAGVAAYKRRYDQKGGVVATR